MFLYPLGEEAVRRERRRDLRCFPRGAGAGRPGALAAHRRGAHRLGGCQEAAP